MAEEILVDVAKFETRLALIRDGELREVYMERPRRGADGAIESLRRGADGAIENTRRGADGVANDPASPSLIGNIYRGKVERVIPGIQAAFIDIGQPRAGFLHAGDASNQRASDQPRDIAELVYAGQSILVQVSKDPFNGKAARLTTNLALAARHLVLLPLATHIGISRRIADDDERQRLRTCVEAIRDQLGRNHGYILRSAAATATPARIRADVELLNRLWERIQERCAAATQTPLLVFEELPMPIRVLRDMASPDLNAIVVNDATTFVDLAGYLTEALPEYRDRLRHYQDKPPLFEAWGVEASIERALSPRVALPGGGYLVIEHTEAMATIDVNSGAYTGSKNLAGTAFKTNLEAARIIPRELQLRNIGGIIVVDFIDMEDAHHRDAVLTRLAEAAANDPAQFRASGFSPLGLVEISRRRGHQGLLHQLCAPCPTCAGRGVVKSAQSVCHGALRAVLRQHRASGKASEYVLHAAKDVIDRLRNEDAAQLAAIAGSVGPIRLQVEPDYRPDEFTLVPR